MTIATAKSTEDSFALDYHRNGFASPIPIISPNDASIHRKQLEAAEAQLGRSLHYLSKVHTILTSLWALATHDAALDKVEKLIGPDILVYNVTYIIKEANTVNFVSWHQDLTYWGFDGAQQVSMWLALSPADETSGCMRMITGSHRTGQMPHFDTNAENNVLSRGQEVAGVDEAHAVACPLRPGEASFHHGWTLHASAPNKSADRRIGLNVQYISPSLRQTGQEHDTAILVRGYDNFGHYANDIPASSDLDPKALKRLADLDRHMKEGWQKNSQM